MRQFTRCDRYIDVVAVEVGQDLFRHAVQDGGKGRPVLAGIDGTPTVVQLAVHKCLSDRRLRTLFQILTPALLFEKQALLLPGQGLGARAVSTDHVERTRQIAEQRR